MTVLFGYPFKLFDYEIFRPLRWNVNSFLEIFPPKK